MTRKTCREAEQQIEIKIRAQRDTKLATIHPHRLVGIHSQPVGAITRQFKRQPQQTCRRERHARLNNNQPVGNTSRHSAVNCLYQWRLLGVNYHDLQVVVQALVRLQTLQGLLLSLGIAALLDHQHFNTWSLIGGQPLKHPCELLLVRISRLQPLIHGQALVFVLALCCCLSFFNKDI
ncbi:hypothetical protein D3C77_164670 [compost metagenome]